MKEGKMMSRAKYLTPPRPASPVRKIKCARGCGYVRPYTDADWYLSRLIDHPYYGTISGENLVQLDLYNHDCKWHLERRARARQLTGATGRIYL